ncbi:DUF1212-domain-containing protein [Cylindrobasidium torrendii FP15055 ss-10]|uniref:DUF1212-domain-containing protein n=1 Tax=Cylindrobasidium torrendii FP15055 ss-10 TaxID=1314674 RepID=A0A0D7B0N1_9AGAR|nr:DUF1212-domain-containing protein [Cylindrobasidium torrendii FP15055 ss-10]
MIPTSTMDGRDPRWQNDAGVVEGGQNDASVDATRYERSSRAARDQQVPKIATPPVDPNSAEERAANIVRRYSRMPHQSMRLNIERRVRDEESSVGGTTRPGLPNGVLSSLLTLYNNQHQPRTVDPASQASTAVNTPGEYPGGGAPPYGSEWSGAAVAKQAPGIIRSDSQLSTYTNDLPPLSRTNSTDTLVQEGGSWGEKLKSTLSRTPSEKRKKAEIYITRHVAQIIERQDFILRLARAMMMFGAPSHRLQAQITSTARVLEIDLALMYLPDIMLISFDDATTGTSSIRFIREPTGLDLGKLSEAYELYWKVIHDDLSVNDASAQLIQLMQAPKIYPWWLLMIIGGLTSSFITVAAFNGSFLDALAVWPLGAILIGMQLLAARHELYSNVFEIVITAFFSFIAGGMAASHRLCYPAIASGSVILILPGFIVLSGGLEIMSRSIVSGSVRMVYAVIYTLFLGFGLGIGAKAYTRLVGSPIVGITDYTCTESHDPTGGWWQVTPSPFWAFLTVPGASVVLSLRNFMPIKSVELVLIVAISSIGFATNFFAARMFVNQADIASGVGAFAVGLVANLYSRFFSGNAFVIMVTGILFQVPSGLGAGGLFGFVSQQSAEGISSNETYQSGFQVGLQLISVTIGVTVGLGLSLLIVHPIPSRKRGGGVFSM